MKTHTLAILLVPFLAISSCNRAERQTPPNIPMDASSGGGLSDSAMSILRAYQDKRLSADATAKALLDEVARTKGTGSFGLQVDDQLLRRRAVLREAGPGRFYLDELSWEALRRMRRRMALLIGLLVLAVALVQLLRH